MTYKSLCDLVLERAGTFSYSCLMLDLGFLSPDIAKIQRTIDPDSIYDKEAGFGLEHESHITIKYGIHETKPSEIFSKIKVKPVRFALTGLSLFENEKYDVLKLSVKSPDLHQMNAEVCKQFACTDTYPTYIPHCTVAYLDPGEGRRYIKMKSDMFNKEHVARTFIFSSSDGSKVWHSV